MKKLIREKMSMLEEKKNIKKKLLNEYQEI